MRKYQRVTYEHRCHIAAYLQVKRSVCEIAQQLGFHKSTVYREIKRNGGIGRYEVSKATSRAANCFKRCRRKPIITLKVASHIKAYALYGWSPEQIAGRLKRERRLKISYQTIYRKYYVGARDWKVIRKRSRRRSGGRSCQRRNRALSKRSIHERPLIADQRKRIGDWERDGAYGANRKQILVLADRKSRYTRLEKMESRASSDVAQLTKKILSRLGKRVYSVTNDNGTEFNDAASLPWKVYYSDPYKPQQRGTVENTIGLLREYITRKTDLEGISQDQLKYIENQLNFRPRKCLDFETPYEKFFKQKVALAMEI
ncbi:MAG: IS30 family transposase [Bdellovibrionales bacterium]|nr:IS30 family transposase [Bdellovibrionales bacterium]